MSYLQIIPKYFCQLLHQWYGAVAFALGLAGLIFDTVANGNPIPKDLFWVILIFGFIVANIRLYVEQQRQNAEYESQEANIDIEVVRSSLYHSRSSQSPFPDLKVGQDGFTEGGLPGWARIASEFRFRNAGYEEGGVEWAIHLADSKLPAFLAIEGNKKGTLIDFNDRLHPQIGPREVTQPVPIKEFELRLTQLSPKAFAKSLSSFKASNCGMVIQYRTTRVSGYSEWKKLKIEFNTRDFVKSIVEYWREHPEFKDLADLADPNHEIA